MRRRFRRAQFLRDVQAVTERSGQFSERYIAWAGPGFRGRPSVGADIAVQSRIMYDVAITVLRDADAVDEFILAQGEPVLLLISSGLHQRADEVMASLCEGEVPPGRVACAGPAGSTADRRAREFLTHIPHTDRACLVLMRGTSVLDVLRSTDVEAHGAQWAVAHFAERFLTPMAGT